MLRTIKSKILFSQIVGALIIALSLGFSSFSLMVNALRAAQKEKMEFIASYMAEEIKHNIFNKKNIIERISKSREIEDYSKKYQDLPLKRYFIEFREEFPVLSYINEKGFEELKIVKGQFSEELRDISETVMFQDALWEPNKVFISPIEHSYLLGEPVMKFIIAKQSYFGEEFIGVVLGEVPLSEITREISRIKVGETGFLSLIDKDGNILAHLQKDKILSKIIGEGKEAEELISNAIDLKKDFTRATILGVDGFVAYAPVKDMAWSLMVTLPYEEFIMAPNSLRNISVVIFSLIFIASLVISFIFSRSITHPLSKLAAATSVIAKGDFLQKVNIRSKDEIGSLGRSFNKMAEELKKMTEQLVSKEYTDNILKNMSELLVVTDFDAKIKTINKITAEVLGYKEEELIGKPLFIVFAEEEREPFKKEKLDKLIEKGKLLDQEINYQAKDGRKISMIFNGSVIRDNEGNVTNIICIALDITQRKKAYEKLMEYTTRIEKINKDLNDFTYIISHDLKEPLRSIDAFSKFIEDDYIDKLDEKGRNYLGRIRANASRIQKLIEDLLEFSHIEKRGISLDKVGLKKLVDEVKLRLSDSIRQKNAEIIVGNKLPVIFCDREKLTEVFINLVSNAIEFNDKPHPCVEIGYNQKEVFYEFYVKDNGPGIEEQYFDKIFEIFQRLGKKEEHRGTGAGLTIVKKIVQMHKGEIWVESKIGEGTTFYFIIPREKDFIIGRKKLGEILMENKLVTESDLKKTLDKQAMSG